MRVWVCRACGQVAALVFWPDHNYRGTSCCLSLAYTVKLSTPTQLRLI